MYKSFIVLGEKIKTKEQQLGMYWVEMCERSSSTTSLFLCEMEIKYQLRVRGKENRLLEEKETLCKTQLIS